MWKIVCWLYRLMGYHEGGLVGPEDIKTLKKNTVQFDAYEKRKYIRPLAEREKIHFSQNED